MQVAVDRLSGIGVWRSNHETHDLDQIAFAQLSARQWKIVKLLSLLCREIARRIANALNGFVLEVPEVVEGQGDWRYSVFCELPSLELVGHGVRRIGWRAAV